MMFGTAERKDVTFSTALLEKPTATPDLPQSLVTTMLDVTRSSTHSYEAGVHRLLCDVIDLHTRGVIDRSTQLAIIGTAIDVLFFFNYDHELLKGESNLWYRASIIHQMGQGMLQALGKLRPDLSAKPFFREAMAALALTRQIPHPVHTRATPLHCKQWV